MFFFIQENTTSLRQNEYAAQRSAAEDSEERRLTAMERRVTDARRHVEQIEETQEEMMGMSDQG